MSGRHQPENGADSPEALRKPGCIYQHPHPDHECRNQEDMVEARAYYVVTMEERYGEERMVRRIYAWGKNDARNLAQDIYPEWVAVEAVEEAKANIEDRRILDSMT